MIAALALALTLQAHPADEAPTSFAELGHLRGWFSMCAGYGWRVNEQQMGRWQAALVLQETIVIPHGEDSIAVMDASTDQFESDLVSSFRASARSRADLRSWADRIRAGCDSAAESFPSILSRTDQTDTIWNRFVEAAESKVPVR